MADSVTDLRLDGDRTVSVGDDGDLETVSGIRAVEQSAAIHAGSALRALVGEPVTAKKLSEAQTRLREHLESDPQLDDVQRVVIDNVDKDAGTVGVRVFVGINNEFTLDLEAQ